MKTKIMFAMMIALFLGIMTTQEIPASNPQKDYMKELRKKIRNAIGYPCKGFSSTECCSATVTFFLEQSGDLTVKQVSCDNQEVRNYVMEKFSTLNCKGVDCPTNTYYRIKINFRRA